jgi:Zn-dependent M28 family amino/carboxypeptidase
MDGEGSYEAGIPQVHIHLEWADELMMGLDSPLEDLQRKIDSLHQPASQAMKTRASIKVAGTYAPHKTSMNVVGILPGSDSILKNEYIVISAHLDHVGRQGSTLFFPGANDNASGSAAVLQLARAFSGVKPSPARSVIFVLYTSEEQGLIGSAWFAEHCPVNTDKVVAALNMDCIAYGDSIQIGNGESNPNLWKLARTQDSLHSKLSVNRTWHGGGADLDGLYKRSVPGLYFVTTRSYDHLHLPSDTPETLNNDLYTELVKLVFRVSRQIATGDYTKEKVEKKSGL